MSACGGPAEPVTPSTTTDSPASPSPSADPGIEIRAQLREVVHQTGIDPKAVGGTSYAREEPKTTPASVPCNATLTVNLIASHTWAFESKATLTSHETFAYYPELGTAVVDAIRAEQVKCTTTWTFGGGLDMKAAGQFAVAKPNGFDNALGFCHEATVLNGTGKGTKAFVCEAFLSRGHLMSRVSTVNLQKTSSQNEIKKAVPIVAAAVVKAQPAV